MSIRGIRPRKPPAEKWLAAGVKLPKPIEAAARTFTQKDALAGGAEREAVRTANGVEAWAKAKKAWEFEQATGLKVLADWKSYPDPRPNVEEAKARAEALRAAATFAGHELDALLDYAEGFRLIDETWSEVVDFRKSIDPKTATVAEFDRLTAKADKVRPLLLDLARSIAESEFEHKQERKRFLDAVRKAGRPLDLDKFRKEQAREARVVSE